MGLIKAAKRFDETRGFKFISYAVWWIRQSILQAIAAQGRLIRLPANQIGVVNKITRILNKFEQENERIPNIDELAREVDLSEEHIEEALSLSFRQVSMDSPFKNDDGISLLDVMPSTNVPSTDKSLVDESLKEEISRALKILSEREQKVLCAYYGIGQLEMSLEEIGDKFGLSRERVRQIKEKAIRNLRKAGNNKTLRVYLG